MPSRFCRGGGEKKASISQSTTGGQRPPSRSAQHTYLHNHHLDRDVIRQSDGRSEVLGQRHQQVQDGNDTLGVDGWEADGREARDRRYVASRC